MKKFLLLLLLVCNGFSAATADDTSDKINVFTSASETPESYLIDDVSEILFTEDGFTIVMQDGGETPYSFADFSEITFDYTLPQEDNIADLPSGNGLWAGSTEAKIYSLSGAEVSAGGSLPSGIYIVKKGTQSLKMVRK